MAEDIRDFHIGVGLTVKASETELYEHFNGSTADYARFLFEQARLQPELDYHIAVAGFNDRKASHANNR